MPRPHPLILALLTAFPALAPAAPSTTAPATAPATTQPFADFTQKLPFATDEQFEMIALKGGTFTTTDPKTGRSTAATVRDFWIGRTEVTWDQFNLWWLGADLSRDELGRTYRSGPSQPVVSGRPTFPYLRPTVRMGVAPAGRPVMCLPLHAAQSYAKWLAEKTGRRYRLPTEAEWEYACRAGAPVRPLSAEEADRVAWFNRNCEEDGRPVIHQVAQKAANPWGLHDMLGNVAEWCLNPDGTAAVRGGSYLSKLAELTARTRAEYSPRWQADDPQEPKDKWWLSDGHFAGFRLACDP